MTPDRALMNIPALLWRLVSLSSHRLLALDLDGTLAPFNVNRARVRIPAETLELLQQVTGRPGDEVVIISGRPLKEVVQLTAGLTAIRIGEHGWESTLADGRMQRREIPSDARKLLMLAEQRVMESGFDGLLERKHASRVLHTRALAPSRAREIESRVALLWQPLTQLGPVRLDEIHGGLELRALGFNKGNAIQALLAERASPLLTVYMGDDTTDEDAFEAVAGTGFGVRVGTPERATLALGWLESVEKVPEFLREWLRRSPGGA